VVGGGTETEKRVGFKWMDGGDGVGCPELWSYRNQRLVFVDPALVHR
jgi:hypothetical protein